VDVELGDEVSTILYEAAKLTWPNREGMFGEIIEWTSNFRGRRGVHVGGLPLGTVMNLGFDGVGTKVIVAQSMGKHDTIAFDLFAMVCDDAVVQNGEPVMIGSVLDVNSLRDENDVPFIDAVKQLARGYVAAAKEAGVVVVNGEVAELGACIRGRGDFNYNWGAGVAWFGKKGRLFKGDEIEKGDSIVALKEEGLRSNGLSLVRKVLSEAHGNDWHKKDFGDRTLGDLVLEPSRIYSRAIVAMSGGAFGEPRANVHGVVHVTGGGIPSKLGSVLEPSGKGAVLNDLFEPTSLMIYVQHKGGVGDAEAYRALNMGNGMFVISGQPDGIIEVAREYDIDARVAGEIVEKPGIRIRSKGNYSNGRELSF